MFRQRLRVFFTKEGSLRFISHHDLMRLIERALRRTGLPLKLSEGFNPRPQVSFPAALALAIESSEEIFEFELTQWVSPARVKSMLERQLPEGIGVKRVESVRYGEKAEVVATEFSVELGWAPDDAASRVKRFLESETAFVERRTKSGAKKIDVRGFVKDARFDGKMLRLVLSVSPAGTVRPQEVLEVIFGDALQAIAPQRVKRTRLHLSPASP